MASKIDRLAGIVMILHNNGKRKAEDLARIFEVSQRTIYRDIQALSEIGVPVVAETGNNGGYSLIDDYNFSSIKLTLEEAEALYLGIRLVAEQEGLPLAREALKAGQKVASFLPGETQRLGEGILKEIERSLAIVAASSDHTSKIRTVRSAINDRRSIRIKHRSFPGNTFTTRVDPYSLVYSYDLWQWVLVGYCHRQARVTDYWINRLSSVEVTEHRFDLVCSFEGERAVADAAASEPVVVRVDQGTRLAESLLSGNTKYKYLVSDSDEDWVYLEFPRQSLRYPIHSLRTHHQCDDYIIRVVMGLGAQVEVVSPEDVRQRCAEELGRSASLYAVR